MSKLLPCPFCGGGAHLVAGAPEYWVKCLSCNASSDTTACSLRAVNQWNKRHTIDGRRCETKRMEMLRQAGNRVIYYGCDKSEWDHAVCSTLSAAPRPDDV